MSVRSASPIRLSTIFAQFPARASRRITLVSGAVGLAALLGCADRTTAPSGAVLSAVTAGADHSEHSSTSARLLVTGLHRARGSAIGPDGALYVTESEIGRISRVDPSDGTVTTFASGFPTSPLGAGGVVDVAFVGSTAYALVTIVGSNFVSPLPGDATSVGIYRVDGPTSFTFVADIGKFSAANLPPPDFPIGLKTGVQFALEPFRGGFLVSDGHHNRVLRVTPGGEISTLLQVGNIVPTGLTVRGNTIYMTETGPIPHAAADGKVVTFSPGSPTATTLASGEPLMVDVEFGRGQTLFAISQGIGSGGPPATPAVPNTGKFVRVNGDGTFTTIKDGLDRPTSLKFIGNTAYVVTLAGEVWKIDNVASPPFGNDDARSGEFHATKECSEFHRRAGEFCTITWSNLKEIPQGTRVYYLSDAGATALDSDVILDPPGPGNNTANGHVVLNFATLTGTVELNGGTGKFQGIHASVIVTHLTGVNWAWDGTYSYSPPR